MRLFPEVLSRLPFSSSFQNGEKDRVVVVRFIQKDLFHLDDFRNAVVTINKLRYSLSFCFYFIGDLHLT